MKEYWEADRVENPVSPGTPDVYFTLTCNGRMGWIELKHLHEWPKRPDTIVKIDHYTPQQKSFIRRHGERGALVCLLIQIKKDYFLFGWKNALNVGEIPKEEYFNQCIRHWANRMDYPEFTRILAGVYPL